MENDTIEKLFIKYYNEALLYSLSLTKNKAIAESIVSTAFFKALKTADNKIANFKPWLLKVCRNTYYSHYKQENSMRLSMNLMPKKLLHLLTPQM